MNRLHMYNVRAERLLSTEKWMRAETELLTLSTAASPQVLNTSNKFYGNAPLTHLSR